jgi:hypothetical protein
LNLRLGETASVTVKPVIKVRDHATREVFF